MRRAGEAGRSRPRSSPGRCTLESFSFNSDRSSTSATHLRRHPPLQEERGWRTAVASELTFESRCMSAAPRGATGHPEHVAGAARPGSTAPTASNGGRPSRSRTRPAATRPSWRGIEPPRPGGDEQRRQKIGAPGVQKGQHISPIGLCGNDTSTRICYISHLNHSNTRTDFFTRIGTSLRRQAHIDLAAARPHPRFPPVLGFRHDDHLSSQPVAGSASSEDHARHRQGKGGAGARCARCSSPDRSE